MEIKILLLLLLAHYILFFLFRGKSGVLACGIFAWSGADYKRFNKQKFDILGLFNNTRGGDSCGVSTDGEIYYGTVGTKNYDDFVIKGDGGYVSPTEVPVVIGHARKASIGAVSEVNAHPFGFGDIREDKERKFEFVGCHNGTLSNHDELGKKYDVETSVYNDKNIFQRHKVDSEILLEIIYKTGDHAVLEEYIGGAALLFQNLNHKNILYAFHGASKKEVGDRADTLYEERPLYYYQESRNSVYISSMEEALIFIGGVKDKNVFEFKHNILYKIKDGNVEKAEFVKVDRKGAGQKKAYGGSGFIMGGKADTGTSSRDTHHTKKGRRKERSKSKRFKQIANVSNIYDETVIEGDFKSAIYYNKLRYWRNGHLISGVFTYIKGYGLYKIGDQAVDASNKLYQLMGEHFSLEDGMFLDVSQLEARLALDDTIFVPFELSTKEPPVFFLHDGIMLETVHDYIVLSGEYAGKFSFEHMSQMSKYPICRMRKNRPDDSRQEIIYNTQAYTNNFIPLQCNNCYNIEGGNLLSIDRLEDEIVKEAEVCCAFVIPSTGETIQLPMNFDAPIGPSSALTNAYHPDKPTVEFLDEDPPIEDYFKDEEEDEKVLSIINKHIMPVYIQIQTANEDLKNEDNETIKEIIDLNKEYLISVDCIVESKSKENEGETVKTVGGIECLEKSCRLIDGQYYLIGDNKIENSGDIYLINNRYIRFSTERIVFDHFDQEYKLKNNTLIQGIIGIGETDVVLGYFSRNDIYNVRVIMKDLSEKIAIAPNVLGFMFRERRSDGVFYHISLIDANKFNQLRGISREIKESFPYDSKGSIAKVTKTFEAFYKPVICKNAEIVGASFKDYTFGFEFETCAGIIPNNKLSYLPLIPLRDGSISGIEYATIPLQGPVGLQALIDSVDELKRRTSFSDECSLHVHVGGMPRTVEFILAFYKTISLIQNDMFAMFPLYKKYNFGIKRKNYSAPFPFEEINFKMDPVIDYADKRAILKNFEPLFVYLSGGVSFAEYNNDLVQVQVHPQDPQGNAKWNIKHRYSFVNLIPLIFGNHQTIEFRIHTPTYDINKIINFLMINIYIIDYVKVNYKKILAGTTNISLKRPTLITLLEDYVGNIPDNGKRMIFNELVHYIAERKNSTENITRDKGVVYQEEEMHVAKSIRFNTYKYYKKSAYEEPSYSFTDSPLYDAEPKESVRFKWAYSGSNPFDGAFSNSSDKLSIKSSPQPKKDRNIRAERERARLRAKGEEPSMGPGIYDQFKMSSTGSDNAVSNAIKAAEAALDRYKLTGMLPSPGEWGVTGVDAASAVDYNWDPVLEEPKKEDDASNLF